MGDIGDQSHHIISFPGSLITLHAGHGYQLVQPFQNSAVQGLIVYFLLQISGNGLIQLLLYPDQDTPCPLLGKAIRDGTGGSAEQNAAKKKKPDRIHDASPFSSQT